MPDLRELLNAWLDTSDHNWNCDAYNEGQSCCLYKDEVFDKLREILLAAGWTPPS